MAVIKFLLYGVFGVLLSLGGISLVDQPGLFLALLGVVLAIDFTLSAKL